MNDTPTPRWQAHRTARANAGIRLGLDRVATVIGRAGFALGAPLLTVAGTNGKGSTCALLEAMLAEAGYRTGAYFSPHLVRFNERIRIGRRPIDDALLDAAFDRAAALDPECTLTEFELDTIAARIAFEHAGVEALVMEVGLGGRLDAVNAFEPDCAIVTSVAMDHMALLGDTREQIGWEKAHVYRTGRPALCADPDPPATLVAHASAIGAQLMRFGHEYGFDWDPGQPQQWTAWNPQGRRHGLGHPALRGRLQLRNAATAIAALDALRDRLPVTAGAVRAGLATVELAGRFQVVPGRPTIILDVGHNPEAAAVLAQNLADMGRSDPEAVAPHTFAVCAMLRDKDMTGVVRAVGEAIDEWFIADLPPPRGASAVALEAAIRGAGIRAPIFASSDVPGALAAAREAAGPGDRIVVFGSFLTVAAAIEASRLA